MLFAGTLRRVTVSFPYIMSTFSMLLLYVKLSEMPVTRYGNVCNRPVLSARNKMIGYAQPMNSTRGQIFRTA